MEFLFEYGLFLAKTVTIVLAIVAIIIVSVSAAMSKQQETQQGKVEVTDLSEQFHDLEKLMQHEVLNREEQKAWLKAEKEKQKQEAKERKQKLKKKKKDEEDAEDDRRKRIYVIEFEGDINASETTALREEITAILTIANPHDEVVIRLESPGGVVHGYGLAASQLQRLRDKNITLVAAVDKVAASGGYMMACVANRIIAAPFAVIGSIGVIAQLPNFNRLLKKHEIDFEQHTAGDYKRTLTIFGENTDEARNKFREELQDVHILFKDFIREHRPELDIDTVATGEAWYGKRALERGLIDEIKTSDDYLMSMLKDADLFKVKFTQKPTFSDKLSEVFTKTAERLFLKWRQQDATSRFEK